MSTHKLSDSLNALQDTLHGETITFGELAEKFEDRSLAFFMFLLALPASIPIPGPGINLIVALPLLLLTAQLAMGRQHVWFPRGLKEKAIKTETVKGFINKTMPHLLRVERFITPRLQFLTLAPMRNIIGVCGFIMSLSISLPLPLTNTVPSIGVTMMSAGILTRDGLLVIAGILTGLCWIALLTYIVIFIGVEGFELLKDFIT
jgi:hypothetical protein